MIQNFFKIAFRSFRKYNGFFSINILGLAIGIACSVLIMLYVQHELSYDKFHSDADRIYRLHIKASIGNTSFDQAYSSSENQRVFKELFPEIVDAVKILYTRDVYAQVGQNQFNEGGFFAVDSNFFDFFDFKLIEGNANEVLQKPNSIVLTQSTATKYFGTYTNIIGKEVKIQIPGDSYISYTVTGVAENTPTNSHFKYDYLLSLSTFPEFVNNRGWTNNNFRVYYKVQKDTDIKKLESKLAELVRERSGGEEYDSWVAKGNYWIYYFIPLTDIHLHSDVSGDFEVNGNESYVYIIFIISIIILVIACINFMNLTTAKSSIRSKEIGIRKILGSAKNKLIRQFLSESFLYSFIALSIGMAIVESVLPYFNNFVQRDLEIRYFENWYTMIVLLTLWIIVGLFSGLYPAFIMSSYKSLNMLQGNFSISKDKGKIRNILVTFQFATSSILLIATMVVYFQINFMLTKDIGFDKEHVVLVETPTELHNKRNEYKELLLQNPAIESASASASIPGRSWSNIGFSAEGIEQSFTLNITSADEDYLKTMKMEIVEGRWFDDNMPSDSHAVVLNETAIRDIGIENPIGKYIFSGRNAKTQIIGVLKDIHYESLHGVIRPMGVFNLNLGHNGDNTSFIAVRYKNNISGNKAVEICESSWQKLMGSTPFNYTFLDSDYNRIYNRDKQTRKIFTMFSILAIIIASLGLLGLVSFITERKTKEIGIRKAVGASIGEIMAVLNISFLKLVLLSNIVAIPIAYYAMSKWLENFAFRIKISPLIFILTIVLSILIALLTASLHVLRAAGQNPVNSLRYE